MPDYICDTEGNLLGIIVYRSNPLAPDSTEFYTPHESTLQVGRLVRAAGSKSVAHQHRPRPRTIRNTGEVLIVIRGEAVVGFSGEFGKIKKKLRAGDIVVILRGEHEVCYTEETEILEVKQGPYQDDKVYP